MNILVIAAHPDDEILGCGGTIARHTLQGDVVHLLILAEGATSRDFQRCRDQRQIELSALAQAAHQAGELLGVSSVTLHDFPDNRMDSCDLLDVTKMVEQAIEQHRPHLIYTHHGGDLNIDHRCVHSAVMTATRPVPNSSVNQVLSFEVASSTEWQFYTSSAVFFT